VIEKDDCAGDEQCGTVGVEDAATTETFATPPASMLAIPPPSPCPARLPMSVEPVTVRLAVLVELRRGQDPHPRPRPARPPSSLGPPGEPGGLASAWSGVIVRVAAMVEQPSGTVTLVFTDIEGSTRLLHELGQEPYREASRPHGL
jgi:hypothetical protein